MRPHSNRLKEVFFTNLHKRPRLVLALGIVLGVIVEVADFLTGPEVPFSIFYLLVVVFFAWFLGIRYGTGVSALAGIVSVITDIMTGHPYSHQGVIIWTAFMRTALFVIVAFLLDRLQKELRRQKEDNEKLLRAYEEIQNLSKVKDDFTAMVSHELRTPLTAIRETMSIVYDGAAGPISDEQKEYLEMSKRNVERLSRLIDDVLDFFKMDTKKREFYMDENDIRNLINQIAAFYSPLASKKGLAIQCSVPLNLPHCVFDFDSMSQVLANLVANAVKFTQEGVITVGAKARNEQILIYVKDAGLGIAPQDIKRLFKPFEQITPHPEGGTGLGLAICKQIIDQHQGKIWVDSELGKGTTVFISLPLKLRRLRYEESAHH